MIHNQDRLLNRKEVAKLAGLSTRSVDEAVALGKLTPTRFGRAVRFLPSDVDRWFTAARSSSKSARDAEGGEP